MTTTWILKTDGDPLAAVRWFLSELWQQAGLEGMLIPVYQDEMSCVKPWLVQERARLSRADPFAPLVRFNAAKSVSRVAHENQGARFASVLRPCEVRAVTRVAEYDPLNLQNWLIIGVDCLASFPPDDFEWRVQKAGSAERLTREVLQFARQGGIAPYRYRNACQMCLTPASQEADVNIGALGLPVKEYLLVTVKDDLVAEKLNLPAVTAGRAPPSLQAQHDHTIAMLDRRHAGVRERMLNDLPEDLPGEVSELIAHLANCLPCQKCLEACALYAGELVWRYNGSSSSAETVKRWLSECVGCGMCEDACPRRLPLTAVISRLSQNLGEQSIAF